MAPSAASGFAYGTLSEHAEQGEERFMIEWHRDSDQVEYDILSFSRPGSIWTYLAYPLALRLQKAFVKNSLSAMAKAIQTQIPTNH